MHKQLIAPGTTHSQRYRLPGIEREGIAQLSVLETALWPLRGGNVSSSLFKTAYEFSVHSQRRTAEVTVYSPEGLQSIDEYFLWGLLGISLSRPEPEPMLLATPYWIMNRLGMPTGGSQYHQLRTSLERLATVAYQNTGFYNPLTQEHERVTLHFFSSFIPTHGRGGDVATDRAWRIEWDPQFFRMCRATGGSLLFDLDLFRQLTPASRRLFLKLKDRFWRTKRVFLNVDDLTINGLGFSADRPLKKRKYDLTACIEELLTHQVISLGRGQTDPKELFLKRGKASYVVTFYEGPYFQVPLADRTHRSRQSIHDDPLYEPLHHIGVDEPGIRRLLSEFSRGRIQTWVKITEAAMHEKPHGFPGFRVSPAAFLIDGITHERMPPDWVYAHDKRQAAERWELKRVKLRQEEQELQVQYHQARQVALQAYLQTPDGRHLWETAYHTLRALYDRLEPHRAHDAAADAATAKLERDHFEFPDFGVWLLEHQTTNH